MGVWKRLNIFYGCVKVGGGKFWVGAAGWIFFLGRWGCVEVYFGWVNLFYWWTGMSGGIFWVGGSM